MTGSTNKSKYRPKPLPFLVLGIIVLATTIFATIWLANQVKPRKSRPAIVTIPFVTLQPVVSDNNGTLLPSGGFVRPKYNSKIAAKVSGTVLSISPNFAVGNSVQKGDMLASVSDSDYLAAVTKAQAHLSSTNSLYLQEQAKSRQASRDAKRLKIKATNLVLRTPQLEAAKANITNAEMQLKIAKENLSKTKIKAPFNAIIQSRNISLGDNISTNSIVAQLVETNTFVVKLPLSNYLHSMVSIGDKVELHNPKTGNSYSTTISRFDPSIDSKTRTIGAYTEIYQPLSGEKPLLLNSYLFATIKGKSIPNSIWINNNDNIENTHVWIKDGKNRLKKAPFSLIYRDKEKSLVQFIKPIQHLITDPKDSFFVGETVTTEKPKRKHNRSNKNPVDNHE